MVSTICSLTRRNKAATTAHSTQKNVSFNMLSIRNLNRLYAIFAAQQQTKKKTKQIVQQQMIDVGSVSFITPL